MSTGFIENVKESISSSTLMATAFVRLFGLTKIPLLAYCKPSVIELNEDRSIVMIPLSRRTKNHLNSMYFGVLAVGADIGGGLIAMDIIRRSGKNNSLVFKDFKADFLKRPTGDVHFVCEDGPAIKDLVERCLETKERENLAVKVKAIVPSINPDEVVADFTLTLSLKERGNN